MLPKTLAPLVHLFPDELRFEFFRSSGPGGQNVNKVETAVRLRFDVRRSVSLPLDVKERLLRLVANRLTGDGVLVIEARRFRTQEQNRLDALQRFVGLVRRAVERPRPRKKTAPTQASREERLREKKKRSAIKENRRGRIDE